MVSLVLLKWIWLACCCYVDMVSLLLLKWIWLAWDGYGVINFGSAAAVYIACATGPSEQFALA